MNAQELLQEISDYCRQSGLAESTFGRRAVNDGKLTSRLRNGGRITTETLDRIRSFMSANAGMQGHRPMVIERMTRPTPGAASMPAPRPIVSSASGTDPAGNFRFFDNRQKYLLFVNTCSEKWVVANRVALELANIHPRPPAVRVFDAGMGDGTVLTRVMRAMHHRYPNMPFYISGKEISLEDIRLTLEKMPDRFFEHPSTVLVLTNMYYSEAPWLTVKSAAAAGSLVWNEVALTGNTSHDFEEQITGLQDFLSENWKAGVSAKSGNPVYEKPVVLVLYRQDHKFLLDPIIPHRGQADADFDLVIASQPYRARASAEFKASKVIAPLARALGPGGRLIAIHSHGDDPGMDIINRIWPDDHPFTTDRHAILREVKKVLGPAARDLNFNTYADNRSIFQYQMHTLPNELAGTIGTSTALAAWNAAIYVAQVEDERLNEVVKDGRYIDATREVLREHNGLWFNDESYVISRRRD
jgi:SAM-dependent methyltransferase